MWTRPIANLNLSSEYSSIVVRKFTKIWKLSHRKISNRVKDKLINLGIGNPEIAIPKKLPKHVPYNLTSFPCTGR